jgi:hypothetical protein
MNSIKDSQQGVYDGGFASTCPTNNANFLAFVDFEGEVLENEVGSWLISCGVLIKLYITVFNCI